LGLRGLSWWSPGGHSGRAYERTRPNVTGLVKGAGAISPGPGAVHGAERGVVDLLMLLVDRRLLRLDERPTGRQIIRNRTSFGHHPSTTGVSRNIRLHAMIRMISGSARAVFTAEEIFWRWPRSHGKLPDSVSPKVLESRGRQPNLIQPRQNGDGLAHSDLGSPL
jgi:hypothetical protein